jgi:hypothetical protein
MNVDLQRQAATAGRESGDRALPARGEAGCDTGGDNPNNSSLIWQASAETKVQDLISLQAKCLRR